MYYRVIYSFKVFKEKMPSNGYEYQRAYYIKNRDHIFELIKTKVECDVCHEMVQRGILKRHQTSKKCLKHKINKVCPHCFKDI